MTDIAETADRQRIDASVKGDLDLLAELIADDCRYVHSTGAVDTKDSYLAKLREGVVRYTAIEAVDQQATDLGGVVLLTHVMVAEMVLGGVPRPYRGRVVAVWRTTTTPPQLVYFQSTGLPID